MTNLRKSYEDMTFPQKQPSYVSSGRLQNPAFDFNINSLEEIKYVNFLLLNFYSLKKTPFLRPQKRFEKVGSFQGSFNSLQNKSLK